MKQATLDHVTGVVQREEKNLCSHALGTDIDLSSVPMAFLEVCNAIPFKINHGS